MSAFKYKDEFIVGGGSSEGDGIVELTQAEYDALGPSVETDGKIYLITDGEPEDTLPGNTALLGDTIATVEDASRDADTLEGHNASYFGTAEQISSLNDTITNKTLVPISSENIQGYTSGSASYLVRSGYCVVSFNGLKMSSGGTISNVPKCLMYSTGFVTTGQVTPNVFIQIEGTNMTIQGNTSPIYGTVIYPLDLTV